MNNQMSSKYELETMSVEERLYWMSNGVNMPGCDYDKNLEEIDVDIYWKERNSSSSK